MSPVEPNENCEEKVPILTQIVGVAQDEQEPIAEDKVPIIHKTPSTCPTCHGKGKLTQSQADRLVALIPASDKRLRPRRTKLYLCITAVTTVFCLSLTAFFLWPRPVYVTIIDAQSTKIHMPVIGAPWIDIKIVYELNNTNFFPAQVSDLKTTVQWNKFTMISDVCKDPINVGGLGVKNQSYTIRQTFSGTASDKVKWSCIPGWEWRLFEQFSYSSTVSVLLRSEIISDTYYGYIRCYDLADT